MIPTSVKVGPFRWTVERKPVPFIDAQFAHGEVVYGLTDVRSHTIYIDPRLEGDAVADTLLHELLHAICETSGLSEELRNTVSEESVVRRLTPYLIGLLRDNPKVIGALT